MKLVPPVEVARRARAAIGYSLRDAKELGRDPEVALTYEQVRALMSRSRPSGRMDHLWILVDACGVPRSFAEHGWPQKGAPRSTTVSNNRPATQR